MPTKFEEIYGRALFKFTDYSFLNPCCTDMKEAVLQKYLLASIVDFQHSCKENLNDYDLEKEQFNVELLQTNRKSKYVFVQSRQTLYLCFERR